MREVVLILALSLLAAVHSSPAAMPMVKTQAPSFYRMMLGDFEVTALNDGVVDYQTAQVLPKATPEQIKSGLHEYGVTDPGCAVRLMPIPKLRLSSACGYSNSAPTMIGG
jgi:hypothetical protein